MEAENPLKKYMEGSILEGKVFPKHATFSKITDEVKEHSKIIFVVFKRLIFPACLFYILLAVLYQVNIFASLLIFSMFFIYSNFLPDFDALFKYSDDKSKTSFIMPYLVLFFGPLFIYDMAFGSKKPIYTNKKGRVFHNLTMMALYGIFIYIVGLGLYGSILEPLFLTFFGIIGYLTHLAVDNKLYWSPPK